MLCHVKLYATSVTFECRSFVIISIETHNNLDHASRRHHGDQGDRTFARAWYDPGTVRIISLNMVHMSPGNTAGQVNDTK